jgi:hypothetical protein
VFPGRIKVPRKEMDYVWVACDTSENVQGASRPRPLAVLKIWCPARSEAFPRFISSALHLNSVSSQRVWLGDAYELPADE